MSLPYSTHHPWYYLLGGEILYPKTIYCMAKTSGYNGYLENEIRNADNRQEPRRSESLRQLRKTIVQELKKNLNRYRILARELNQFRKSDTKIDIHTSCKQVHTNISLKHNHLYNDFAHLFLIDQFLSQQPDLFA